MIKQLAAVHRSLKAISGAIWRGPTVQRTLDLLVLEHLQLRRDGFRADLPAIVEQDCPRASMESADG